MKAAALLAAALCGALFCGSAAANECRIDPLKGRALYLRGGFNAWASADAQRFTWACNRFELVTTLRGEHSFKLGDEAWSADADFGAARDGSSRQLALRGADIRRRFQGTHRITLSMATSTSAPTLSIEDCPAEAPLGRTQLFMRGSMNNWAALDDYAFNYSCDAYYLNVSLKGRHEFKLADAAWAEATSFGDGKGNYAFDFNGEHTVRVAFSAGRPLWSVGAKSFADPAQAVVVDPVALSLRFDSRSGAHKKPFGAVVAGTPMHFTVTANPGVTAMTLVVEKRRFEGNQEVLEYLETARVPMQKTSSADVDIWAASQHFSDISIYGYWFEAQINGRLFVLQNNADSVHWTREKGTGGAGVVADKPSSLSTVRRFRQTVYAADFHVPAWASDIVYYYIFPDRFRNGNPANDPKPGVDRFHKGSVELHRNWLDKPWRPGSGDGSDALYNNDFFGGDLAGIIDKLDYIKDLGANTLYLTPIFKAVSNHKYDTADYQVVDPAFGSNADFERLTTEATRRGMRVILDTSLNHSGSDSIYFDRYGNFKSAGAFEGNRVRADSPYASWYSFNPAALDPERQYRGWVNIPSLPEFNKASPGWRDFAYRSPSSVTRQWLDRGAAGWRMDVAPWVSDDFWREWRAVVKAQKSDALTVSEVWFDASKYLLGDMFDATMNYIFRNAVQDYASGGKATAMVAQLEHLREAYPPQAHFAQMNLLSSHDQARALHVFGWHDEKDSAATVALAKQRLLLGVFMQMTYPGAPTIYYGDEVGVTGGDDPDNRRTYPWADLGGKPDLELLARFKQLTALRLQHAVLRRGSLEAPLFVDEHVMVLARHLGTQWALTLVNNAATTRRLEITLPDGAPEYWGDPLGAELLSAQGRKLVIEVPALFGRVLIAH